MYYKTKWNAGDIITTEKLNNIFNNISSTNKVYFIETSIDTNSNLVLHITKEQLQKLLSQGFICYYIEKEEVENEYEEYLLRSLFLNGFDWIFDAYSIDDNGYIVLDNGGVD